MSRSISPRLRMRGVLAAAAAAVMLAACGGGSSDVQRESPLAVASNDLLAHLALPSGSEPAASLPASLRGAKGEVEVWVQLADAPVALKKNELRPAAAGASWKATDDTLKAQLRAYRQTLRGRQDGMAAALAGLGAKELGRVQVAHNALALRVDASRLAEIAAMSGVVAVRPVRHYELMLGETVPYIGGSAAQGLGYDGSGVKVAVLDSGIDYTHRNMGGAGTTAAYAAAYGAIPGGPKQTTRDGLFPTAKVVAGYDFVGEAWPNGDRSEDDDPIDFEGHGTHVADIIAGIGPNKGVAPGAQLVAVKVCSAVSSSCNGVALLKGMDYALDPNGDGDVSDAVDVINLSLGSSYGQQEDDLSQASANAVTLGVSVVASAGNSADRPYITGSPAAALGVLSVAQTQVPSAQAIALTVTAPASIAGVYRNTNTVDWAPIGAGFAGQVQLASGIEGQADNLACAPLPAGSMMGKVALIDRGSCSISWKVDHAADAGAVGVLLVNNAAGDAPTFSFGGTSTPDNPFNAVPTLVLTQADGNRLKANAAAPVQVSVSPAVFTSLVGSMASTSSRGPSYSSSGIKPEIGAPGASLSAEATTGDQETVFGGTSGAAPMVAGSAALLRAAFPDRSPEQIKAMLMNSAYTQVYTNPAALPGALAPISRIGAGEVRVDRALKLTSIARNLKAKSAALSFGFAEVDRIANLGSELLIENFGPGAKTYTIASSYRYADDAASGATRLDHPATVTVPAGGSAKIDVRMIVDGTKLPAWTLNGGSRGGDGFRLQGNEVDGYVTLSSGGEMLSVPFHALLRKSASISTTTAVKAGSDLRLQNNGANDGGFDVFALTGTSPRLNPTLFPAPGDSYAVIDLRAVGVRAVGNNLQFAIHTWNKRAHPVYPGGIEVGIDTTGDGAADYYVYQQEFTGFAATGQSVVYVQRAGSPSASAVFFNDADLQSGNVIFTVPMAALGITPSTKITFYVLAYDNYFTGWVTDAIEGMTFTPGTPRFAIANGNVAGTVAARTTTRLPTIAVAGGAAASPSQSGLLLLYRQNKDQEASLVSVSP